MKGLALALSFAVLAASACTPPVPQTAPDPGLTLVEASDWRTRAPELIGKRVELHGNLTTQLAVDPGSEFSNTGVMKGGSNNDVLATVLFDQISKEQIEWIARNRCYLTGTPYGNKSAGKVLGGGGCDGVYVRGVVEVVGAGPVLDMTDISFRSRAGGGAVTPALAAPALKVQEVPTPQTGASAVGDSGWTLVPASDWRARVPWLIGKRVELSGDLSTEPLLDPRSSLHNRGAMRGEIRRQVLAIVLFDQISDEQVTWMARNNCLLTCKGVFVRGVVVIVGAGPVLRMIDISSESRAGSGAAAAAGVAALNISETDAGASKPLLPKGALPNRDATAAIGGAIETTKTDTTTKKRGGGLLGMLRSAGSKVAVAGMAKEGMFRYGDAPLLSTYYRNIRDTELSRVFANSNSRTDRWPRVALVVEEATEGGPATIALIGGRENTKTGDDLRNRCWRLSARLWTGPATSRNIPSFNWCLTEMHYDRSRDGMSSMIYVSATSEGIGLWAINPKPSWVDENTGQQRTMGPNPPYIPFPANQLSSGLQLSDGDDLAVLLGNILREMAFNYGYPDGRVWVVRIPGPVTNR